MLGSTSLLQNASEMKPQFFVMEIQIV